MYQSILSRNIAEIKKIKLKQETILEDRIKFDSIGNYVIDELGTSLVPDDIEHLSTSSVAIKTTGNGNCLFNATSLFICGDESLNNCLRILTAAELFLNATEYTLDKRKVIDTMNRSNAVSHESTTYVDLLLSDDTVAQYHVHKNLVDSIQTEALKTSVDKTWSGLLQVMGLAQVLEKYCSIISVYPNVNYVLRDILNGKIYTNEYSILPNEHTLYLMWSRDGTLSSTPGAIYEPNHFVPILAHGLAIKRKGLGTEWKTVSKKQKRQSTVLSFFAPKQKVDMKKESETVLTESPKTEEKSGDHADISKEETKEPMSEDSKDDYPEKSVKCEPCEPIIQSQMPFKWNTPVIGEEPNQPNKTFPTKMIGKRKRSFQHSWFVSWQWLHYEENLDKVFCHVCIKAYNENKLSSQLKEKAFICDGFNNWKKATNRFREHQSCNSHSEAVERVVTLPKGTKDVGESISDQYKDICMDNRKYLITVLSNIKYLARQGLPLRGDADETNSNFIQLLKLRSIDNPTILSYLEKKKDKLTSPEIQNEILQIMANTILRDKISDIQKTKFISIMADESVDCSNKEQLVICLRWVDNSLQPHEDFLGLYQIQNIEADTIFNAIRDVFQRFNISLDRVRGQCYDMAAAMAGSKNGVATKIRSIQPAAVYMHCYGHALNLACSDAIKRCAPIQNALDNTREITKLIKLSPRRDAIFKEIKNLQNVDSPGIRVLCPTRWTVRAEALYSVLQNYHVLQEVWDEALDYVKEQEMRCRIRGIALYMQTFDFLFGTVLGETILRNCDNLAKALQKERLSAAEGNTMASLTVQTLQSIRSDNSFKLFWEKTDQMRKDLGVNEAALPRRKTPPKRIDDGASAGYQPLTVLDHYRKIYFEALDLAINCIKDRMDQPGYRLYVNLENLLLKTVSGQNYETELDSVCNFYVSDINRRDLETQLNTIKCDLSVSPEDASVALVSEYISTKQSLFSEIETIIRLILVMPATNAVSERSFSNLRRVKSYLRSSMSQTRLNHLMIMHTYQEETDALRLVDIGNQFINVKPYRKMCYGEFSNTDE